ncbi:hypothetical protein SAMN05216178_6567 [Pseudomonas saponiphila]|jgi:hypothetical protein|uniref:Uncharacterized protein n=1 Tax=Pseudomonas saponiphila TaxID=556534 RepID=A0A1H4ZC01_9PSED|nr:hypothetical protein [Pseudomonas saponiphila]SED27405.1 hypothetical protein SAMN05216178_6567 [Pseudomonas saponiphila]
MRLNVTSESDTYAMATSPLSFGGISKEDLLFWMIPMGITKQITEGSILAFGVGLFCLWLYKKATADKPQGHLILSISLKMGEWEQSDFVTRTPPLKVTLRKLNKLLASIWLEVGLIPSPTFCNKYEP